MISSIDLAIYHGGHIESDCVDVPINIEFTITNKRIVMSLEDFNEFVEEIKQRERARCALACEGHGFGGVFAAIIRGLE